MLTIKIIGLCIAALLAFGWGSQWILTQYDKVKYPPPGHLVDVGGYRLHVHLMGSGKHTVVLESGINLNSLDWSLVQPKVAEFAKVCSYDRAGLGWSDAGPYPRTSTYMVKELHDLLVKAKISGPYILVGHSFGGINIRLFASKYPDEVEGIVLVDASPEDSLTRLPPDPAAEEVQKYSWITRKMVAFGVPRFLICFPKYKQMLLKMFKAYPESIQSSYLASMMTSKFAKTALEEHKLFSESLTQFKAHDRDLKDKPLIVITAGSLTFFAEEAGYSPEWMQDTFEKWNVLQKELVNLSTRGKQIIAKDSDHLIPRHQPQIIVDAIRDVINSIEEQQFSQIEQKIE